MWRPWHSDDRGQTSAEWLGVMVVVASIVAVLAASGIGTQVSDRAGDLVCDILNDDCTPGEGTAGAPVDTDGDGLPYGTPGDTDGDGIPDGVAVDVDGDGRPDGVDVDGDGVPDGVPVDVDGDGVPDGVDVDGDGVPDTVGDEDVVAEADTNDGRDGGGGDGEDGGDDGGGGGVWGTIGGWIGGGIDLLGDGAGALADGAGALAGGAADTVGALVNGFVTGDAGDGYDSGWLEAVRNVGQIGSGILVFGDVRDGGVAVGQIFGSGGRDGWLDLGLSVVGLVPVVGDAVKGARGVARTADAVNGVRDAGRAVDDLADAGRAACSFAPDTPVLMADNSLRPISAVAVGDLVWAADPTTGREGPRTVTAVWSHPDTLVVLATSAGTVTTTADHPFYNATDGAWQPAAALEVGDRLATAGDTTVTVTTPVSPAGVAAAAGSGAAAGLAYNLTVDDLHTYHVAIGDHTALVHNACPTGLRDASPGLVSIFDGGSVRGRSIIDIRANLTDAGFTQRLADNGAGYRFTNSAGEEVRIMSRNGSWDIRIRNADGNYLDEFGNVAGPGATHDIAVTPR